MSSGKTYHPQMTRDERDAWIAGLTPSQKRLVGIPDGWRYTAVVVALAKRWLSMKIPDGERLMILERINSYTDTVSFTQEILETIGPLTDLGQRIVDEAISAFGGFHRTPRPNLIDFFAEIETFDTLVHASPTLGCAVDLHLRLHNGN